MKTVFPLPHACIVHRWDASMQPRGTVWQRRAMLAGSNHLPACLLTAFRQAQLACAARPTRQQQLRPQDVCCSMIRVSFRNTDQAAPTELSCDMSELKLSSADRGVNPSCKIVRSSC